MTSMPDQFEGPAAPKTEMFAEYPELLTPAHIAEITGLTVQYVRTLCRKGKLPAVQIGEARWYVPKRKFIGFVMTGSANA